MSVTVNRNVRLVIVAVAVGCGGGGIQDRGPPSSPFCPGGVVDGNYAITNPADVARIAACKAIAGELTVSQVDALNVPKLESVGGLHITHVALKNLTLPSLETVGGSLDVYGNAELASVALPVLTAVSGSVNVRSNDALASLSLPMLERVGRDFRVSAKSKLPLAQATETQHRLVSFKGIATIRDDP